MSSPTMDVFAQTAKNPTLVSAILALASRQAAGRRGQARGIAWRYGVFVFAQSLINRQTQPESGPLKTPAELE
jgi:hypothetical protein